jgi:hypothetical protein
MAQHAKLVVAEVCALVSVRRANKRGDRSTALQLLVGKSSNGNTNCSHWNAICVKPSGLGPLTTLGKGQSVTFTFDINCSNCTQLANWTFLSQGNGVASTGNCYAISTHGTAVSMPEPSVIALYISTLAALGIALVWRSRSRLVTPPSRGDGLAASLVSG